MKNFLLFFTTSIIFVIYIHILAVAGHILPFLEVFFLSSMALLGIKPFVKIILNYIVRK